MTAAAARQLLESRTTASLCEMYEAMNNDRTENAPMVRGWIMDTLEARDPEAFDRWIDSDDLELSDCPSRFFNAA